MEASDQAVKKYNGGDDDSKKTPIRVGAVIALALLAGFIAWIVIDRTGNDSTATATPTTITPTTRIGPVAVSASVLSALAANVGHIVYWAGPIPGTKYEFTKTSSGRVFVRYLPAGVAAGDKRPNYQIIATYPFRNAYDALKKVGKGNNIAIPGGGIAVVSSPPTNVYFAYPDAAYQGEIYDPSTTKALETATSGTIQPVP